VIFTHSAGSACKKTMMACWITSNATGQQAEGLADLKECGIMSVDQVILVDAASRVAVA
jgi:hypothetical protein